MKHDFAYFLQQAHAMTMKNALPTWGHRMRCDELIIINGTYKQEMADAYNAFMPLFYNIAHNSNPTITERKRATQWHLLYMATTFRIHKNAAAKSLRYVQSPDFINEMHKRFGNKAPAIINAIVADFKNAMINANVNAGYYHNMYLKTTFHELDKQNNLKKPNSIYRYFHKNMPEEAWRVSKNIRQITQNVKKIAYSKQK